MKVTMLNVVLKDMDDEDIDDVKLVKGMEVRSPLTLRKALMNSITFPYQDDQNLSEEEKLNRFDLALKVKNAEDPAEFTPEEVAMMRKLSAKFYGVIVSGRIRQILK